MANYVNLAELKTVLGVGDLYPDAQLTQVGTAATNLVLSMLSRYSYGIDQMCCEDGNTVKARTVGYHRLYVGQSVTISGLPSGFNGNHTVLSIGYTADVPPRPLWPWPTLWPYSYSNTQELYNTFTFNKTGQQTVEEVQAVIPYGTVIDAGSANVYQTDPLVLEACMMLAVEIWQARVAPGGTIQGVDFQPGPFRLGRSLIGRVQGLLAPHLDVGTMVG